jgi:hypothetical protein
MLGALLQRSPSYTLEEKAERPADAFSQVAAAAEAAQLKLISSASVTAAMAQSKQVADIMQLYSQLQTTYHIAMLALLKSQGPLAGTTAGLAYTWFCNALGTEPELSPGDEVGLDELVELAEEFQTTKDHPYLGLAAEAIGQLLQLKSANQPVEELVLPDIFTYLSTGLRTEPDGLLASSAGGSGLFACESIDTILLSVLTPCCPPTREAGLGGFCRTRNLNYRFVTWLEYASLLRTPSSKEQQISLCRIVMGYI